MVSSSEYQRRRPDVVLAAVSSRVRAVTLYGDRRIRDWEEAGLLKPSVVKPMLVTVHKKLVLRRLGALESDDLGLLRELLAEILG